ncbi:MAG: cell division protein FtsZ, partial [Bacteroidia bacterium]|nr:cell division protein FtsZ [Bacteroidia bacterium]
MSSNNDFGISFDLPKNQSNVIKVIGVGGGGSNAINHMFQQGIKGVDFVICNTDAQALNSSGVPVKIQLGVNLTEGLGAGANPEIGEQAALESLDNIQQMLDTNTKMIFITAGMGGGTGTGAAPIIAKLAKDLDILTVGIVTMPFHFEGKLRIAQAQKGVENLRQHVDSLVVINNNKLREVYGNLGFKAGFSKADEVLSTAARGIAEVITHHYTQNIDLRDAKTVLSDSGTAIMGSSTAAGSNRAQEAIVKALDSPLLNDNKITGAKNVLLLIVSGSQEITIDEIGEINDHIQTEAGYGANIIMGVGEDEALDDAIAVTIIATGFNAEQQNEITNTESKKVIHALEEDQSMEQDLVREKDPVIITPDIVLERDEKVIHTLIDDENLEPEMDLVATSDDIKNMDVVYDEILAEVNEEDFIIHEIVKEEVVEIEAKEELEEENQTLLPFDQPIDKPVEAEDEKAETITFSLDSEAKDIEVNDYIVLITVTEANESGETRYTLDDHIVLEETGKKHTQDQVEEKTVDEEIVFEKKVVDEVVSEQYEAGELDPVN